MTEERNKSIKNNRQKQLKIIVENEYIGTEKMESIFKKIAQQQIEERVKKFAGK